MRMNQYPHLRNIAIMPFDNRTVEIHLAEEIRDRLISSFQQDGRLRIVYENPDSRIEGEITDYSDTVYGFDMEQEIEEYQVSIRFSIIFTDLVRNQIIWENRSLTLNERYSPASADDESIRYKTPEAAQEAIFEELFKLIIRNSLEAW